MAASAAVLNLIFFILFFARDFQHFVNIIHRNTI